MSIQVDPIRAANPIEKWRKRKGLSNPEVARLLGYGGVGGYHRLVRCEICPLEKLAKFAEVSGEDLSSTVAYYRRYRGGR